MGGVWNFFFAHVIHCLSKKTGGHDQSPSYITKLAHALIFQRKVDFAQYFFTELVEVITAPKKCHVAYPRFITMILNHKLESALDADRKSRTPRFTYDWTSPMVGVKTLNVGVLDTDQPLRRGMITLAISPDLRWGDAEIPGFAHPDVPEIAPAVVQSSPRARVKSVGTKKKSAPDTSATASRTMAPINPSVPSPVRKPSSKRRHSTSPPKLRSKKSRGVVFETVIPDPSEVSLGTLVVPKTTLNLPPPPLHSQSEPEDLDDSSIEGLDLALHGFSPDHFLIDDDAQPSQGSPTTQTPIDNDFFAGIFDETDSSRINPSADVTVIEDSPTETPLNQTSPRSPSPVQSPQRSPPRIRSPSRSPSPPRIPFPDELIFPSNIPVSSVDPDRIPAFPYPGDVGAESTDREASLLEDLQEAARQCRLVGTQFESFKQAAVAMAAMTSSRMTTIETRLPQILATALADALQPLTTELSSLGNKVDSLTRSHLDLAFSFGAFKVSSDLKDAELRRLLSQAESHQDFSKVTTDTLREILDSVQSQMEMDLGDFTMVSNDIPNRITLLHKKFDYVFREMGFKIMGGAEGEKKSTDFKLPYLKKSASTKPPSFTDTRPPSTETVAETTEAASEGEQHAKEKDLEKEVTAEGEQPSAAEDTKGKKNLTPEQLAELEKIEKKRLKYGSHLADSEKLILKAPTSDVQEPNLGLTPQEIEEARLAQKALDESRALSLKMAEEEAQKAKSTDALSAQKSELSALEGEKNEEIAWYKKKMHHRSDRTPITGVKIATNKTDPRDIRLIINREDGSMNNIRDYQLRTFGLPEWFEISRHLAKAANPKKEVFVKYIDGLMTKMKEIKKKYSIVLTTEERSKLESLKEEVRLPKFANPPDTIFKDLAKERRSPNVSNLNLNLPTSETYPTTTLALSPIPGLYFNDGFGKRAFFRFSQIPIADTRFLEGLHNLFPNIPEAQQFYRNLLDEIKRRKSSKK